MEGFDCFGDNGPMMAAASLSVMAELRLCNRTRKGAPRCFGDKHWEVGSSVIKTF